MFEKIKESLDYLKPWKTIPSFTKAFERAKREENKSFFEKVSLFFDFFDDEMKKFNIEKKQVTTQTEQKTQQTLLGTQDKLKTTFENLESAGQKAVKTATEVASDTYNQEISGAKHCWDWVSKIYAKAGVKRKEIFSAVGKYSGKNCGNAHAGETEYGSLSPGDHIFYNLQTRYDAEGKGRQAVDSRGNHSAIFIRWIYKDNKIAQLASGSYGTRWHMHKEPNDFNKTPITRIFKPVVA
ncbi:hypothetical protein HZC20_02320 [Candidatus Peregrinibacteria bacterium]|nr:hypothetical protein [Candidatus Peregrinibacteria bacterium]